MKLLSGLLTMILLAGCAGRVPAPSPVPPNQPKDWTVTVNFDFNFTNYVPCSTTVTKSCITGFTWGYSSVGVNTPLATLAEPVPVCTSSLTENCTTGGSPAHFTVQTNSLLPIGSVGFFAKANYIDQNGAAASSSPGLSASSITVSVVDPTSVTGTAK